ncbi:MAG: tetratricopeptide repeat protein, partial [Chloroflexi bacterium]|nr:tetratricopeptide repeat protein [Chloroflexota bacterium]
MLDRIRRLFDQRNPGHGLDPPRALEHYKRGVTFFDEENWHRAEQEFSAAIQISPPAAGMYHHRGSAFAEQGKHLEAVADYDAAIRLRPGYPDAYVDRGNSYHALDR